MVIDKQKCGDFLFVNMCDAQPGGACCPIFFEATLSFAFLRFQFATVR